MLHVKNIKASEKSITSRANDFSQWYLDVIAAAELAENGPVRGTMIIKPYGYALWERIQDILDARFKETGVQNAYFPMFIPEKFLKREADHVEGFAPEIAVVTYAGGKKLEEPLVVRPTSETIIYDTFSRWIQSYRDLPLLINQWANVVRWEMRPRLFLRTTEFLWQEGHTVHETMEEADKRARQMLDVYKDFVEQVMAIPVISGVKSEAEKFAGALRTYSIEAMMQDGKALQLATSHNLGTNFAKVFDVSFLSRNGEQEYGSQTSWGLSTRTIGGLIMAHGDDKGLVLPPRLASIQVIITTIGHGDDTTSIEEKAWEIMKELQVAGIRAEVDARELRPGEKFYEWEKKGMPIRIEIGPKDVKKEQAVVVRRDTGEKKIVSLETLAKNVGRLLDEIQSNLYERAKKFREDHSRQVDDYEVFKHLLEEKSGFLFAHWCESGECEKQIAEETKATIRCIPLGQHQEPGVCIRCGNASSQHVIFAQAY